MENTNIAQSIKKQGSLNPMWGKSHNEITKRKISDSQKERYAAIRKAIQTEEVKSPIANEVEQDAKLDLLKQCIFTDSIQFRDKQQALNFIYIMSDGIESNYLKRVINDELDKYLTNINRHMK